MEQGEVSKLADLRKARELNRGMSPKKRSRERREVESEAVEKDKKDKDEKQEEEAVKKSEVAKVQEMRKFNDEINKMKNRFARQMLQERSQAMHLVSNLEAALENFQLELKRAKEFLPVDSSNSTKEFRGSRRISMLQMGAEAWKKGQRLGKELVRAASTCSLERCIELLDHPDINILDINYADAKGKTAMHHLMKYIDEDFKAELEPMKDLLPIVLRHMIELGGNVNQADVNGFTPFYYVCKEIEVDLVKLFIRTTRPVLEDVHSPPVANMALLANPNVCFPRQAENNQPLDKSEIEWNTIWHLAIEKGSSSRELLSLLIEAQLLLEAKCRECILNQESAAEHNRGDFDEDDRFRNVNEFVRKPPPVDYNILVKRFEHRVGHWEVLLEEGDPSAWTKQTNRKGNKGMEKDGSPLHLAISAARQEEIAVSMVELLLADQKLDDDEDERMTLFDPNARDGKGRTPLHIACERGFTNCIRMILQYRLHYNGAAQIGVNVNIQEYSNNLSPLMCAIKGGHSDAVEELIDRNNVVRNTVKGSPDSFQRLDLKLKTKDCSQTALHLACAQRVEMDDVVVLLCKNKAEVNLKDQYGFSPLHLAAMHGHVMIVKCLLKYNANAAALENVGNETALHIAAAYGHINILTVLLRKGGAEVHAENRHGRTALHHAFGRHRRLSELLTVRLETSSEEDRANPAIYVQVKNYQKAIQSRKTRQSRRTKRHTLHRKVIDESDFETPIFTFDEHPQSPYRELYKQLGFNLELLFLAINNQNMLIKLLLDGGGDLEHEDKYGDPSFMSEARYDWFHIHEEDMTDIYDHPNEMGYDSEIFSDKRTQLAVQTVWNESGQRATAILNLCNWIFFLGCLTAVALRYSGQNSYGAFSMQQGISDRLTQDEWDELDIKTLDAVGNLNDWHMYLKGAMYPAIWEDDSVYFKPGSDGKAHPVSRKTTLMNGQLALLGRPRYRQIRTKPDSCSDSPALLSGTDDACFLPSSDELYISTPAEREDRTTFSCELSSGEMREFNWEETGSYLIMGRFGTYLRGGFSVVLPSNATEAMSLLEDFERCNFVSLNTRVAMIEMTFYSRTQQLFTHGVVFIEFTPAGGIASGAKFETRKLLSYVPGESPSAIVWEILWICLVAMYFLSEFQQMRISWGKEHIMKKNTPMWWVPTLWKASEAVRKETEDKKEFRVIFPLNRYIFCIDKAICIRRTNQNIPPYWVNVFNYVDLIIMFLIVVLLCLHGILTYEVNLQLPIWEANAGTDTYFDISHLLWLAVVRQHILALVVLLCYIKSLEFLQVTSALAIPVIIIGGMLFQLLSFFLIFAVFILAFALFDYVLYGISYRPTSTVLRSIVHTFRAALGDLNFDDMYTLDQSFAVFMTCLAAFLLVILLLNLLIAVMNEAFDEIKGQAEARWCYMQFRMIVEQSRTLEKKKKDLHNVGRAFHKPVEVIGLAPADHHQKKHEELSPNHEKLNNHLAKKYGGLHTEVEVEMTTQGGVSPHRHIAVFPSPVNQQVPHLDSYQQMRGVTSREFFDPSRLDQSWIQPRMDGGDECLPPDKEKHQKKKHRHERHHRKESSRPPRVAPE